MELEKKYFDQQLNNLEKRLYQKLDKKLDQKLQRFATKEDLRNFATKDDLKYFATKEDLKVQTRELKKFAEDQAGQLARIITTTVVKPIERRFDTFEPNSSVSLRVTNLEHDTKKLKKSLLVD